MSPIEPRIDRFPQKLLTSQNAKLVLVVLACGACLIGNLWLIAHPNTEESPARVELKALDQQSVQERSLIGSDEQQVAEDGNQSGFQAVVSVPESEYLPDDLVQPRTKPIQVPQRIFTVKEAAARSCRTSSVEGLSKQIIAQSRCIDPNAFVRVPERPNLAKRAGVFLYLTAPARNHLLAALDANPKQTLVVNSALRTLAQQYLLSRWGNDKRCGIQLVASPGESNHESGLALDISQPEKFRLTLEAHGFVWLGAKDRVHFDYGGKGAAAHNAVDIMAFQQLWNKNNPDDIIRVNGRFTEQTEQRLAKSPAAGFPTSAHCGG